MKKLLLATAVLLSLTAGVAQATNNGRGECSHPIFVEHGCGYEGEDGKDGLNGKDGKDGADGIDGIDGTAGINGQDADPLAMSEMYDEMDTHNSLNLALDSIEIFLPQQGKHRFTLNRSMHVHGGAGNGLGYAYMFDGKNRTSIFAGWGESDGQHAGKFGVSVEF